MLYGRDLLNVPGQTWPPDFFECVRRMEEEDPTDKWVKLNLQQQAAPDARRLTYFAYRVYRALEECGRLTNNVLNPIWYSIPGLPDSIPSNVQPADILYWVRREA